MNALLETILTNKIYIKVAGKTVYFKSPSIELKYKSSLFYQRIIDDCIYHDWLTQDSILPILVNQGLVTPQVKYNLKSLEKSIDEKKVDLYKSAFKDSEVKHIRKELNLLRKKQSEIEFNLHFLDYITAEGYAELLKSQFIIKNCVFYKKKKFFTSNMSYDIFETVVTQLNLQRPNYNDIRALARGDEWSSIWRASKGRPFKGAVYNWTDEQKHLVLISQMFDSVYKSPDCPPDKIINDDDMLDGWLINQRKQTEKDKNERNLENLVPGLSKPGDEKFVFIGESPNIQEQIAEINSLNSSQSEMIKNQRQGVINSKGEGGAKLTDFLDIQLEGQTAVNQAVLQSARK